MRFVIVIVNDKTATYKNDLIQCMIYIYSFRFGLSRGFSKVSVPRQFVWLSQSLRWPAVSSCSRTHSGTTRSPFPWST